MTTYDVSNTHEARSSAAHGSAPLPDHPDSRHRESDETSRTVAAAVVAGTAEVLGRTHYEKDCCWWIVKRSDRYFAFLNDIGEWCWEVSGKCAANYVEVVGGKAQNESSSATGAERKGGS